jgi:hypothetical protein
MLRFIYGTLKLKRQSHANFIESSPPLNVSYPRKRVLRFFTVLLSILRIPIDMPRKDLNSVRSSLNYLYLYPTPWCTNKRGVIDSPVNSPPVSHGSPGSRDSSVLNILDVSAKLCLFAGEKHVQ